MDATGLCDQSARSCFFIAGLKICVLCAQYSSCIALFDKSPRTSTSHGTSNTTAHHITIAPELPHIPRAATLHHRICWGNQLSRTTFVGPMTSDCRSAYMYLLNCQRKREVKSRSRGRQASRSCGISSASASALFGGMGFSLLFGFGEGDFMLT